MALVSLEGMLRKAYQNGYAVGQFNINNLEWTKAILITAEEQHSPVILGVSEGAAKYMTGYLTVVEMVKAMIKTLKITVPVAIHLDHGTYEGAYKAIEAGFSSIMFDGSEFPIEENIAKTKELVEVTRKLRFRRSSTAAIPPPPDWPSAMPRVWSTTSTATVTAIGPRWSWSRGRGSTRIIRPVIS